MSSRRKAIKMNFSKKKGKPQKPKVPERSLPKTPVSSFPQPAPTPVVDAKAVQAAIAKDEFLGLVQPPTSTFYHTWDMCAWGPEQSQDRLVAKAADQKNLILFENKVAKNLYTMSEIKAGVIDGVYIRGSVLNEKPLRAEDYFGSWTSDHLYQVPPDSIEFARVIQHARDLFGPWAAYYAPSAIHRVQNRKLWTRHVKSGGTKLLMHGTSKSAADDIIKNGFLRSKLVSAPQFYFSSNARVCTGYFKTTQPALVLAEVSNTTNGGGPVHTCMQESDIYPAWVITMNANANYGAYNYPVTAKPLNNSCSSVCARLFFFVLVVGLLAWWFWTRYYAPKPAVALMP